MENAWELTPKARDHMDPISRDCWDAVLPLLRDRLVFLGFYVQGLPPWPPSTDRERPSHQRRPLAHWPSAHAALHSGPPPEASSELTYTGYARMVANRGKA